MQIQEQICTSLSISLQLIGCVASINSPLTDKLTRKELCIAQNEYTIDTLPIPVFTIGYEWVARNPEVLVSVFNLPKKFPSSLISSVPGRAICRVSSLFRMMPCMCFAFGTSRVLWSRFQIASTGSCLCGVIQGAQNLWCALGPVSVAGKVEFLHLSKSFFLVHLVSWTDKMPRQCACL